MSPQIKYLSCMLSIVILFCGIIHLSNNAEAKEEDQQEPNIKINIGSYTVLDNKYITINVSSRSLNFFFSIPEKQARNLVTKLQIELD